MDSSPARGSETVCRMEPSPAQQAALDKIAAGIAAAAGPALPGTLADRMTRCGHRGCRCHADPPQLHGPYHQWTRKKNGKTATRILSDEQLADYGPWFDNHRRIRELVAELKRHDRLLKVAGTLRVPSPYLLTEKLMTETCEENGAQ